MLELLDTKSSCQGLVGAPSPTAKLVRVSERACPQHGHFSGKAISKLKSFWFYRVSVFGSVGLILVKTKIGDLGRRMARSGRRVADRVTEGETSGVQGAG